MAGNARFHDKQHRTNHHSVSSTGFIDSATDPIASHEHPFQGDFVINGILSANKGIDVLSANFYGDVECENLHVRDTTYTNFISGDGTETIISDGALTGFGDKTMTMDFRTAVYAKTPLFVATNNISAANNVYSNGSFYQTLTTFGLTANSGHFNTDVFVGGNILINGNLSALGDYTEIETTLHSTSSVVVNNFNPALTALTVYQNGNNEIAVFGNNTTQNLVEINNLGLSVSGKIDSSGDIRSYGNVYGTNISDLQNTSGSWNSSYNTLTSTSANWVNSYNSLTATSANWNSSYNTLTSISASWVASYNSLTSTSGNWNSSYNTLTSTSANWNSTYNTVTSNSANWNNSYVSLTSNSANWDGTYSLSTQYSANWNSSYNSLTSTSANWDSTYSSVNSNSGNWDSVYTTSVNNSGDWLSGNNSLNFISNSVSADWVSANNIKVYGGIFVSVSSVTTTTSASLGLNSPYFWFINPNGAASVNVNLPSVNGGNTGLIYTFKNTYSSGGSSDIHINNSGGGLILALSKIGQAPNTAQFIWDGTTWQTITLN